MKKARIEELDNELGILEASYDADSDDSFRKEYLISIKQINNELIKLGGKKYISNYVNN
jgi:hypothetical protein